MKKTIILEFDYDETAGSVYEAFGMTQNEFAKSYARFLIESQKSINADLSIADYMLKILENKKLPSSVLLILAILQILKMDEHAQKIGKDLDNIKE